MYNELRHTESSSLYLIEDDPFSKFGKNPFLNKPFICFIVGYHIQQSEDEEVSELHILSMLTWKTFN